MITRADTVLIVLCIIALPIIYRLAWQSSAAGAYAQIWEGNTITQTVSLNDARSIHAHGPLGVSDLEISRGQIRFIKSPCPGKQCTHSGWLSRTGETAICLPNRISVTVVGNEPGYDAVTF